MKLINQSTNKIFKQIILNIKMNGKWINLKVLTIWSYTLKFKIFYACLDYFLKISMFVFSILDFISNYQMVGWLRKTLKSI